MKLYTLEPSGYLGRSLQQRLAEHGHKVIGPAKDAPLSTIQQECVQADALLLDLTSPTLSDSDLLSLLSFVHSHPFDSDLDQERAASNGGAGFVVLGVSSLMTWNATQKAGSKKVQREVNWRARKSSPRYQRLRTWESALLALNRQGEGRTGAAGGAAGGEEEEDGADADGENSGNSGGGATGGRVTSLLIGSGILYGNGENDLHHLFRQAWMYAGEPGFEGLPLIGEGKNIIPTIHVFDLCSIIRMLLEAPPNPADQEYFVAVDAGHTTQKQIVSAIAAGMGDGRVKQVDKLDEKVILAASMQAAGEEGTATAAASATAVSAAASVSPSSISHANSLTNGNPELLLADMKFEAEWLNVQPMEWVAEQGPASSPEVFDMIRTEYIKARDLRPMRIMVTGAPGAGKSFYAAKLAEQYYIPHIQLEQVIADALQAKDEFAERLQAALAESATALKATKPSKGKGKKDKPSGTSGAPSKSKKSTGNNASISPQGPPDLSVYDNMEVPRISPYLLSQVVKRRVRQPLERNKGFVLDGFPRTLEEAQWFFSPDVEEDPETGLPIAPIEDKRAQRAEAILAAGDDEDELAAIMADPLDIQPRDPTTTLDRVIFLQVSHSMAQERVKRLPTDQVRDNHSDEEGFTRRWARWVAIMNADPASGSVPSVDEAPTTTLNPLNFIADQVEVLEVTESLAADVEKALHFITLYCEKGGKPNNFHPTPEEEAQAAAKEEEAKRVRLSAEKKEAQEKAALESSTRTRHATNAALRRAAVLLEDNALVEASSLPIRNYLMDHVIPALVDGLLDVCKVQPEDPVDYLAEYLFKYSVDTPMDEENAQERPQV